MHKIEQLLKKQGFVFLTIWYHLQCVCWDHQGATLSIAHTHTHKHTRTAAVNTEGNDSSLSLAFNKIYSSFEMSVSQSVLHQTKKNSAKKSECECVWLCVCPIFKRKVWRSEWDKATEKSKKETNIRWVDEVFFFSFVDRKETQLWKFWFQQKLNMYDMTHLLRALMNNF